MIGFASMKKEEEEMNFRFNKMASAIFIENLVFRARPSVG